LLKRELAWRACRPASHPKDLLCGLTAADAEIKARLARW
jgi:hypothetical protein